MCTHFDYNPVKIGVLARDKIKLVKAWERGNLTLMSLPNFHLEMTLNLWLSCILPTTVGSWETALSLYNEITKPTALMCTWNSKQHKSQAFM